VRIVIDKLAVLNPFAKLPDEETAARAARAGAVGAWLAAVSSAFGAAMIFLKLDVYVDEMRRQVQATAAMQDPAMAEAMMANAAPSIVWTTIGFSGLVGLVYVLLGVVQWRRKTRLIPLLLLLFAIYGLAVSLLAIVGHKASNPYSSLGQLSVGLVLSIATLLCFIAGTRGGFRLHALKKAG
jgi:hypothetical protein